MTRLYASPHMKKLPNLTSSGCKGVRVRDESALPAEPTRKAPRKREVSSLEARIRERSEYEALAASDLEIMKFVETVSARSRRYPISYDTLWQSSIGNIGCGVPLFVADSPKQQPRDHDARTRQSKHRSEYEHARTERWVKEAKPGRT
jgi:hypothetical protein